MPVKHDEVVGFRAIANALEEDIRPGQSAFEPKDLTIAQHFDGPGRV